MNLRGVKLTWLGHSTFLVETPEGARLLIDPWVMGNPACPVEQQDVGKVDALLCTHGHGDHIGDAVEIAKRSDPVVVGVYELCLWMQSKGVKQISPMNKGGSQTVAGVRVTMVHADHSCGIEDDGKVIYGGEPCGYVLAFESGLKLYHAGDTNVFGDMHIIHELYGPEVALLPIGDLFTMSPREAAYAAQLLRPQIIIPMHFDTFPVLTGKPRDLKKLVADLGIEVVEMHPGQTLS